MNAESGPHPTHHNKLGSSSAITPIPLRLLQASERAMQNFSDSVPQLHSEQQLREQVELLKNHDSESRGALLDRQAYPDSNTKAEPVHPLNGNHQLNQSSHDVPRALAPKLGQHSYIHPDLRPNLQRGSPDTMMPLAPPSGHSPGHASAHTGPAIAPAPSTHSGGEEQTIDGRKGAKRELSQSKRAAQNRAAQRAFRQRKEYYIKKLEQQVRDYMEMEQSFKAMQTEHYALREYVIHLQSRLLDAQGECPQPPPNVDLSRTPPGGPPHREQPSSTSAPGIHPSSPATHHQGPSSGPSDGPSTSVGSGTPLEAVAQAVAGLAAQEQLQERERHYSSPYVKRDTSNDDTRSAEEINRHLQATEGS